MDDVFVYYSADMPDGVTEMVCPCADGYTVIIKSGLDKEHRIRAYRHAMRHINGDDFHRDLSATEIEGDAHG